MNGMERKQICVNAKSVDGVRKLITAGKIEEKAVLVFGESDRRAALGDNNWQAYAGHHLGEDKSNPEETRARYTHPVVKDGIVYKSALIRAAVYAGVNDAPVVRAARRLLKSIGMDANEARQAGFDVYRKGYEVCEKAVQHIEQLIVADQIDCKEAWEFALADEAKIAGTSAHPQWDAYAEHHLGEDWEALGRNKSRWQYPVVKEGKVSREALVQTYVKAAERGDEDVAVEASRLIGLIDFQMNAKHGFAPEYKAIAVNTAGRSHAAQLVNAGKVEKTGSWGFSAEDGNKLLGAKGDDWVEYAKWHLGVDASQTIDTKARYKYPFGKDGKIYRAALIAAKQRAAAQGAASIEAAADTLLAKIDKGDDKASGRPAGRKYFGGIESSPSSRVHVPAVQYAEKLIDSGAVNTKDRLKFSEEDRQKMLGRKGDDWENYSQHHMGIDDNMPYQTRSRHTHPFAKEGKCYMKELEKMCGDDNRELAKCAKSLCQRASGTEEDQE